MFGGERDGQKVSTLGVCAGAGVGVEAGEQPTHARPRAAGRQLKQASGKQAISKQASKHGKHDKQASDSKGKDSAASSPGSTIVDMLTLGRLTVSVFFGGRLGSVNS